MTYLIRPVKSFPMHYSASETNKYPKGTTGEQTYDRAMPHGHTRYILPPLALRSSSTSATFATQYNTTLWTDSANRVP